MADKVSLPLLSIEGGFVKRRLPPLVTAMTIVSLGVVLLPGSAYAGPVDSDDQATTTLDTFDYHPLAVPVGATHKAHPVREEKPTLETLQSETLEATASYQSDYGDPVVSPNSWSPPRFEYDFIQPFECQDQPASGNAEGWIKNHYAFCRIYKAERVLERCRFLFGCVTYRATFWVTTIGYGSERERRIQFLTIIDHVEVTTKVGGYPAQPSPALQAATVVEIENLCAPLIQPEDCSIVNNAYSKGSAGMSLTAWQYRNSFYTDMVSTAPGVTDNNPDQLSYADFWNRVTVRWPLSAGAVSRQSETQTARFDTNTYLNLNGRNGAIFSRVRPIIHFPVNRPEWSAMRESGEHYQLAMTHPENTVPAVAGKMIPGLEGGVPLTRLYRNSEWRNENRRTAIEACIAEWGPRYPDGGYQCDEFPFASTREGASKTHNPQRWFSVARITGTDNEAAGTWLGAWYSYDRILDGDFFNVNVTL